MTQTTRSLLSGCDLPDSIDAIDCYRARALDKGLDILERLASATGCDAPCPSEQDQRAASLFSERATKQMTSEQEPQHCRLDRGLGLVGRIQFAHCIDEVKFHGPFDAMPWRRQRSIGSMVRRGPIQP